MGRCLVVPLQFPMPTLWHKGYRTKQELACCAHEGSEAEASWTVMTANIKRDKSRSRF
jgi:hypothetical protein